MAKKVMFQTALTDLETSDVEGKGRIRDGVRGDGKEYRWVKNIGATALIKGGSCLKALTSVLSYLNKNVRAPDSTTAATAQTSMPGGVPVTAIAKSGSSTGDHGWLQIAGPARINALAASAATAAWPGVRLAAQGAITAAGWGECRTWGSGRDIGSVMLVAATGGSAADATAGSAMSASVMVFCK